MFMFYFIVYIYICLTHSELTLNGTFIYNIHKQNICSNAFITVPLCIGNHIQRIQCFDLLYDINGRHIMLIDDHVDKAKGYKRSLSSTYSLVPDIMHISTIENVGTLHSKLITESIYLPTLNKSISHVNILALHEITFNYPQQHHTGVIGFHHIHETDNGYLYLKHLEHNRIISNTNYYVQYTSPTHALFTIGINYDDPVINTFNFCKSLRSTDAYYNSLPFPWSCNFNYISYKEQPFMHLTNNSNVVIFNTMINGMYVPWKEGIALLSEYVNASHNKCRLVIDDNIGYKEQGSYVKCVRNFNYSLLPLFTLVSHDGVNIKLHPVDVFNFTSGESYLRAKKYQYSWTLDLNVLKHYDVFVSSTQYKIGFKENNVFPYTYAFMKEYYSFSYYEYAMMFNKVTSFILVCSVIFLSIIKYKGL